MNKGDLKDFLREKPGYIKSGAPKLSRIFKMNEDTAREAIKEVKEERDSLSSDPEYQEFIEWKKKRETKPKPTAKAPEPYKGGNPDNVLVIGDLHEPFCLDGYLEFCRENQEKYDCGTVVFIGDIIDNHYSSYHESEASTYGPNEEFELSKDKVKRWYYTFPKAQVCVGNHDRMVFRKAKTSGLADGWFKNLDEALETPQWNFVDEFVHHNVSYNHGEGGTAKRRMKNELMCQVQGHLHAQAYIEYAVGSQFKVWGMQVGCGIDRKSWAFAYAKNSRKPIISCGVVLEKGTQPILIPMNL